MLNLIAEEDTSNSSGLGKKDKSTVTSTLSEGLSNTAEADTLKSLSEKEKLVTSEAVQEADTLKSLYETEKMDTTEEVREAGPLKSLYEKEKMVTTEAMLEPSRPINSTLQETSSSPPEDQLSHSVVPKHASSNISVEKGKAPIADRVSLTTSHHDASLAASDTEKKNEKIDELSTKQPLLSMPPSPSSSPRTSKLASKVKLIDGIIPRILHKGEALPDSLSSLENRASTLTNSTSQLSGLNAGPPEVSR